MSIEVFQILLEKCHERFPSFICSPLPHLLPTPLLETYFPETPIRLRSTGAVLDRSLLVSHIETSLSRNETTIVCPMTGVDLPTPLRPKPLRLRAKKCVRFVNTILQSLSMTESSLGDSDSDSDSVPLLSQLLTLLRPSIFRQGRDFSDSNTDSDIPLFHQLENWYATLSSTSPSPDHDLETLLSLFTSHCTLILHVEEEEEEENENDSPLVLSSLDPEDRLHELRYFLSLTLQILFLLHSEEEKEEKGEKEEKEKEEILRLIIINFKAIERALDCWVGLVEKEKEKGGQEISFFEENDIILLEDCFFHLSKNFGINHFIIGIELRFICLRLNSYSYSYSQMNMEFAFSFLRKLMTDLDSLRDLKFDQHQYLIRSFHRWPRLLHSSLFQNYVTSTLELYVEDGDEKAIIELTQTDDNADGGGDGEMPVVESLTTELLIGCKDCRVEARGLRQWATLQRRDLGVE